MFSYLLAMFDYNVLYSSANPTAAMLLFIVYEVRVGGGDVCAWCMKRVCVCVLQRAAWSI